MTMRRAFLVFILLFICSQVLKSIVKLIILSETHKESADVSQLAQDTSITISIYDTKGQLIRTIALGNQTAGIYTTKDKAAYWDGRDRLGDKVSSGVYYYTLQAGNFKATRRMVILK